MHNPAGERFGMLTVVGYSGRQYKNRDRYVNVRCDCGIVKEMTYPSVKSAKGSRSCGCQRWKGTHNQSGTPLYRAWNSMHSRCYAEGDIAYANYGGRGIFVCASWHSFQKFADDMGASFKQGLVLDRIENDLPYTKDNCRWLTRAQSNRNMRSNVVVLLDGRAYCFAELVREHGTVPYARALYRFRKAGWSIADSIGADPSLLFRTIK